MGMMQGGMRPMGARETRRDVGRDWPRCQDGLRYGDATALCHRPVLGVPSGGGMPMGGGMPPGMADIFR